jgi:hypothetical protein
MRSLKLAFCLLAGLLLAQGARADSEGEIGKLVVVEVNTADSDVYALRHGRIVVEESVGKAQRVYLLGGVSLCPNQEVTDGQIDILARAAGNPKLLIKPYYKAGNGNSRCLVSFLLGSKKHLGQVGQ